MPVIEHIEIVNGTYPKLKNQDKKTIADEDTSLIFIITTDKGAKSEHYLKYTDSDIKALVDHMFNGHEIKIENSTTKKNRTIVDKKDKSKGKDTDCYIVTKYTYTPP